MLYSWVIPLSQIRKFLRCASPQIKNQQILIKAIFTIFVRLQGIYLRIRESIKTANHKKYSPNKSQIR
jgi:hypothetical protein